MREIITDLPHEMQLPTRRRTNKAQKICEINSRGKSAERPIRGIYHFLDGPGIINEVSAQQLAQLI
jgi:hypothetical protein